MGRGRGMFWRSGAPLLILVCGGSFGLATLLRGKLTVEEKTHNTVVIGKDQTGGEEASLEETLADLLKKTDIDAYTNKRVPRSDMESE